MAQQRTKQWVEAILFGTGSTRRFTHDSPIQLDVWAQFLEARTPSLELLLVPWEDRPPSEIALALRDKLGDAADDAKIATNRRIVAAKLSLEQIVTNILPFIGWYVAMQKGEDPPEPIELPSQAQLWDDVDLLNMTRTVQQIRKGAEEKSVYSNVQLLSFIRMAGLLFDKAGGGPEYEGKKLQALMERLMGPNEVQFKKARDELSRRILRGWKSRIGNCLPAPKKALVHSVTRNRPARLALYRSIRTVKADAANALFSIDCSNLTWAVMDSGIDATHPAFQRDPEAPVPPGTERLAKSRVRETYDFSYLRELLLDPENPQIPEHVRRAVHSGSRPAASELQKMLNDGLDRIRKSQTVDWELLKPFLRIAHDESYVAPIDTHGTHVAGILGADWNEGTGGERMKGMCPNIRLIDIRVCRQDGTSDEFVIMSALQFIRHLNASSDRMRVHGVNMSLSLDHDAAVYACGRTPICEEAERTVSNGVVVVAAAGNLGHRRILDDSEMPFDQYCPVSITDPGNAESVITVGATHRMEPYNYGVSYFSSRGPTGDGRVKPDLVAPGEKIYAPSLNDSAVRLDGTSMAAPHVSGAAALLMARHTELIGDPQRIKQTLCRTATDLGRERYFQGHGLVDVLRAIQSI